MLQTRAAGRVMNVDGRRAADRPDQTPGVPASEDAFHVVPRELRR
jgi:hypothetical protein